MSTTKAVTLEEIKAKLANGEDVSPEAYLAASTAAGMALLRSEVESEDEAKRITEAWDSAYADYQEVAAHTGGIRSDLAATLKASVNEAVDNFIAASRENNAELNSAARKAKAAAKAANLRLPTDLDGYVGANEASAASYILGRLAEDTGARR